MAPVTQGPYSYDSDTFYIASSNGSNHRRAAPAELSAIFDTRVSDPNSRPDHVGHFYEAQLLHYGLPPSKVKATARMRLLKALQDGTLAVPKEAVQIEKNLKKEWKKQASGTPTQQQTTTGTTTSTRTETVTTTTITTTSTGAAKKTPAAAVKKAPAPKKDPAPAAAKKETAKKESGAANKKTTTTATKKEPSAASAKKTSTTAPKKETAAAAKKAPSTGTKRSRDEDEEKPPAPRKKQTARCTGRGGLVPAKKTKTEPEEKPAPRQTAKRGGGIGSRGRGGGTAAASGPSRRDVYEDPPPSYEDAMDIDFPDEGDSYEEATTLNGKLGLINGEYEIFSHDIADYSPYHNKFNLGLCLAGGGIWGLYEFGTFEGVLHMPKRPAVSSFDEMPFSWRGRTEGEGMSFGPDNEGFIRFLGGGKIEGMINCLGELRFWGQRYSGQESGPPLDICALQDEWDGYNESEYERERVARWR